ncbi:Uma2 family endonuclease [Fischerella thermalis]|uniref:Uma2 family endonuclease n=1 Tax=Fischerella thermalis TaxID=372787 RepID=UPI001A0B5514|nr:Uma2 family endonuclease [Fischerella thermalis]MBF1991273.1 Uma2 family endonuclease [Fischerella thermalis M58_A2018_009]MBF2061509.1 Uma2 family endonuclease [Fischerella thermalis M66_A2018_004]MBF2071365.1 Uma2 family endonuclease [Fischerella thermalis M48_A2018_028]
MLNAAQQLEQQMPDATRLLSDEPEMESSLHYLQLLLLVTSLEWLWREQNDFFIGANLTIYFSRQQLRNRDFRGPDFFLVKDTEKRSRNSWVVWEEDGRYPDLIIELLSDSTANVDRTLKKNLYQSRFHTPEYFWFSPETLEFVGFELVGNQYQEIVPNSQGWRWSQVLGLYLGIHENKLRYFTAGGDLVPTPEEVAFIAQQQAQQATARANDAELLLQQERERSQRLAEQLRSLGIEPDKLT